MSHHKITFGGNPVTLFGKHIQVGDTAENFTVIDGSLKDVKLYDFKIRSDY